MDRKSVTPHGWTDAGRARTRWARPPRRETAGVLRPDATGERPRKPPARRADRKRPTTADGPRPNCSEVVSASAPHACGSSSSTSTIGSGTRSSRSWPSRMTAAGDSRRATRRYR